MISETLLWVISLIRFSFRSVPRLMGSDVLLFLDDTSFETRSP